MIQVEKPFRHRPRRRRLFRYCEFIKRNFNIVKGKSRMVEVGSLGGLSTSVFYEYFNVISVDPYIPGYDDNDRNSEESKLIAAKNAFARKFKDKVEQINKTSAEAVVEFEDNTLDFVYIDGDHTYEGVKRDILLWLPKIKTDGIIGGHDYRCSVHVGVTRAVHELFNVDDVKEFEGQNWLSRVSKIKI